MYCNNNFKKEINNEDEIIKKLTENSKISVVNEKMISEKKLNRREKDPFENTPKKPIKNQILKYRLCEEGIKAYDASPEYLKNLTDRNLKCLNEKIKEINKNHKTKGVYYTPNKTTANRNITNEHNINKINLVLTENIEKPVLTKINKTEYQLNKEYLMQEKEAIRCNNTVSSKLIQKQNKHYKQFELSVNHLYFGQIRTGEIKTKSVILKNVSVEGARIHIDTLNIKKPFSIEFKKDIIPAGIGRPISITVVTDDVDPGDYIQEFQISSEFNILILSCSVQII